MDFSHFNNKKWLTVISFLCAKGHRDHGTRVVAILGLINLIDLNINVPIIHILGPNISYTKLLY